MNDALPGADLIEAGLRDLREGRETIEALLVAIGAFRLRTIGINVPAHVLEHPEMRLYELLAKAESDSAHSRYNACVQRLLIFEHTAEHALHPISSDSKFRNIADSIITADFPEGTRAIRSDLRRLQSL